MIPTYNPARMRNLEPLIRSILNCTFVDKLIVSNNNPEVRICERVRVRDPRLTLLDQPTRRGPGYSWVLADGEQGEYFLSIDDDVLLYPEQVARLFEHLVKRPGVPHGLAGVCGSKYVSCQEQEVDNLYVVYAVTRAQVRRYLEYARRIVQAGLASQDDVELWSDDILLSRTGSSRPVIHDTGFLLQALTCYHPQIALHKQQEFEARRQRVADALETVLRAE